VTYSLAPDPHKPEKMCAKDVRLADEVGVNAMYGELSKIAAPK